MIEEILFLSNKEMSKRFQNIKRDNNIYVLTGEINSLDSIVNETSLILEMWSYLKYSIDMLHKKEDLNKTILSYSNVQFIGFNQKKENAYLIITKDLIEIGGYPNLKASSYISNKNTLTIHRSMLNRFLKVQNGEFRNILSVDEISFILKK